MTETSDRLTAALAGRYRIERELGAGGMATVWLAADLKHDRKVAIKVLHPHLAALLGADRFLKEIKTTANLQHPHILALHDSGDADGLLFYVMPFVEGESLRQRIDRDQRLPIADAVRIAAEVAGALDYAHRHGVIHRDIKPENILLHESSALVADFGIALAPSPNDTRLTETGMSMGTPHYMSPEQALGERALDARSDIYAAGAVLYEMLTGSPPFTGPSAQAIVAKVLTEKPAPPSRRCRDVPSHVDNAVLRALQKNPDDRFGSAAAFLAALDADRKPASRRWSIRRLLVAASIAVILAAAAIFLATRRAAPAAPRSIAVLPFKTNDDTVFSQGLQDVINSALGRLPGLTVKAYSSDSRFRDPVKEFRAVGQALGVDLVLSGVLLRSGDSVRLSVVLLDVKTGGQMLARRYDKGTGSLFALQDDLSRDIADEVGLKLTGMQLAAARSGRTEDPSAHLLLVQARGYAQRRTSQAMEAAVTLYQDALSRDSTYAEAWAGLGQAQNLRAVFLGADPAAKFDSARAAITRALAFDSNSAEAHKALGFWHLMRDRNFTAAAREFSRSLELNPNDPEAWLFRGWSFLVTNHLDQAIQAMQRGKEIDPLAAIVGTRLGEVLYYAGKDSLAELELQRVLSTAPTFYFAQTLLAEVYSTDGQCAQAGTLPLAAEARGAGEIAEYRFMQARCNQPAGREYADSLEAAAGKGQYVPAFWLALVWAGLNNKDKALHWLDEAVRKDEWALFLMRAQPGFKPYRSDPHFQQLMRQVYGNDA